MFEGKRVLVVDGDFLVAFDVQRILEQAGATSPVFVRTAGEAESLRERWNEFDLALVHRGKDGHALIEALVASGLRVVVNTSDIRIAAPEGAVMLERPFNEAQLLGACESALT